MEWYTLDSENLWAVEEIEDFETIIWSERYSSFGDFVIVTKSTFENRTLLKPGTWIGMRGSHYTMKIETISDISEEDGTRNLTVSGRSMEALLQDRVCLNESGLHDLTAYPSQAWTGTPGNIARAMFNWICVSGSLSAKDTIPFYHTGTLLPAGTIPEPSDSITIIFEIGTLYDSIKTLCDGYSLGFRLARKESFANDPGEVYFEVYTGRDLTSAQNVVTPVIFAQSMESLDKVSVVKSVADIKTVAYVLALHGTAEVYAPDANTADTGAERRVLLVKADDIDLAAGTPLNEAMAQRGKDELAKHRMVYAFDGEIPQHLPYIYGIDYNLGDLVEERDSDGNINYMLVTEQIFISDKEGERAYPTLILNQMPTPGTWSVQPFDEEWADVLDTVYWADE
jgi:Siphovirus ReqiPepy6 Gp37-like protein